MERKFNPKCIASTGAVYQCSIEESWRREARALATNQPHPAVVHAVAADPSTTIHLSSPRSLPIALHSSLRPTLLATYPLVHGPTETYLTPHSLLFTPSGTHFLSGSESLIARFDISRTGSPPVSTYPTIPSRRKKLVGGGVGMKGIVSALALSADGVLAAGTFTRNVGLYDSEGSGGCVAVFSVAGESTGGKSESAGAGVTQVFWSPCARYLHVVERKSDDVLMYDIRVAGKKVGCRRGRNAGTNQRLGVDVTTTAAGHELWAGGVDGVVRAWSCSGDVGEADADPDLDFLAHKGPSSFPSLSGLDLMGC
ncbi:MAG: hypothetical protein M1832_000508 [Thelocarpon impressellum]|nr:MAG: hypothetical protein M1832_000508 [Thelocarpon impressellum]